MYNVTLQSISFRFLGIILVALAASLVTDSASLAQSSGNPNTFETLDVKMARVGARVPAYGGMFLDSSDPDTMVVLATGPSDSQKPGRMRAAITEVFGPSVLDGRSIRIEPADYRFVDLKLWYDRIQSDVWADPAAVGTDINEQLNRIVIEVENAAAISRMKTVIANANVPPEAVVVRIGKRAKPANHLTLQSNFKNAGDPAAGGIKGGIQIIFAGRPECTMSFVTDRVTDVTVRGHVTAAHCGPVVGQVDPNDVYQPSGAFLPRIGVEIIDPAPFQGGSCPQGSSCRWSDSSFVQIDSGIPNLQGNIARTLFQSFDTPGTLVINDSKPNWNITAESSTIFMADQLHKVGRTTGWTTGNVITACENFIGAQGILLLCQYEVDASVKGGDSGSPVFSIPVPGDNVTLKGVLWGCRACPNGEPPYVFAPIGQVYQDLGVSAEWRSCVPAAGC